jgi:uncharacterized protein (DUF305 family)
MPGVQARAAGLLLTALFALAATGCGNEEAADPDAPNATDVAFAADMTQHHAQTMQLVNLAVTRTLPVHQWAWTEGVRTRRVAELRRLTDQLRAWGQPVPETGMQHADEGKHLAFDTGIPGVAGPAEMHALDELRGAALARAWLTLMIEHERGAVELAQHEVDSGQQASAVEYARDDRERHRRLVRQLERLVTRAGGTPPG